MSCVCRCLRLGNIAVCARPKIERFVRRHPREAAWAIRRKSPIAVTKQATGLTTRFTMEECVVQVRVDASQHVGRENVAKNTDMLSKGA